MQIGGPLTTTRTVQPIDPEAVAAVQAAAPPDDLLDLVVAAFQGLADPTRARILYALVQRPLCVRDLAIVAGVSESAVSHQLRLLRDRRLVRTRREGNVIYYAVDDHHVAALFREAEYHADHVRRQLPDHPYTLP
jgi:DNA-binding transcriptional ArsR family regulator